MINAPSRPGLRRKLTLLAVALTAGAGLTVVSVPARAQALTVAEAAGLWDLSFEKGNRRCRLTLRRESAPGGHLLGMPAGCRHAFPLLSEALSWSATANGHIVLQEAAGAPVLDFVPKGGPSLEAVVGEDADIYLLSPDNPAVQERVVAAATAEAPPPPAPVPPVATRGDGVLVDASPQSPVASLPPQAMLPPVSAAEVAGNYAVLRQTRDTGCMVTLEPGPERGESKARLAPACRDQGIVIFDPVGWHLAKGELVLTARRGHNTALSRRADRSWAGAPAKGVALVLKRL